MYEGGPERPPCLDRVKDIRKGENNFFLKEMNNE